MTPLGLRRRSRAAIRRLTVRAESNFQFSFAFVSQEQAEAIRDVYQFCRAVDDIVDERGPGAEGIAVAHEQLDAWSANLTSIFEGRNLPDDGVASKLARSVLRYQIERDPLDEIIAGCRMDLAETSYESLAQLELYAYRVASCVGFALLPIFGDTSPSAKRFAHSLGLAMQYTNVLRDVGEDASLGRVYLPLNMLHAAGLQADDLHRGHWGPAFATLARRFAEIAREHYRLAWASLRHCEHRRALAGAEIMGRTYERLLDRIEEQNWDVFTRRLGLKRREKLAIAARVLSLPHWE
jgi:phytoene synthase